MRLSIENATPEKIHELRTLQTELSRTWKSTNEQAVILLLLKYGQVYAEARGFGSDWGTAVHKVGADHPELIAEE